MPVVLTSPPTVISASSMFGADLRLSHEREPLPSMYPISVMQLSATQCYREVHICVPPIVNFFIVVLDGKLSQVEGLSIISGLTLRFR
jgi:hypothetical protein